MNNRATALFQFIILAGILTACGNDSTPPAATQQPPSKPVVEQTQNPSASPTPSTTQGTPTPAPTEAPNLPNWFQLLKKLK